jgi:hypothetical protein
LLVVPSLLFALLLGVDQASPEADVVARIAGAALVAFGVGCWAARNEHNRPMQKGVLLGVLIYDVAAAVILAYAAWFLRLVGIALWPAVFLHVALALWCAACLWVRPSG